MAHTDDTHTTRAWPLLLHRKLRPEEPEKASLVAAYNHLRLNPDSRAVWEPKSSEKPDLLAPLLSDPFSAIALWLFPCRKANRLLALDNAQKADQLASRVKKTAHAAVTKR